MFELWKNNHIQSFLFHQYFDLLIYYVANKLFELLRNLYVYCKFILYEIVQMLQMQLHGSVFPLVRSGRYILMFEFSFQIPKCLIISYFYFEDIICNSSEFAYKSLFWLATFSTILIHIITLWIKYSSIWESGGRYRSF